MDEDSACFTTVSHNGQVWRVIDKGQGDPVVLFHGFPDSPLAMAGVAEQLRSRGFRTINAYLRGYHGDTIVADRPYDLHHLGGDAIGLIDALGLKSASIIGHDWGATTGYAAVAAAPDRIDAFVAISIPHPTALKVTPRAAWALRHFLHFKLPVAAARTRRRNFAYLGRLIQRFNPAMPPADLAASRHEAAARFSNPAVLQAVISYYRAATPKISGIYRKTHRVPHMLVAGDAEVDVLDMETYHRSVGAFDPPGELLVIANANHSPHVDDESVFADRVALFLHAAVGRKHQHNKVR